jgi:putative cell wall-binding protein
MVGGRIVRRIVAAVTVAGVAGALLVGAGSPPAGATSSFEFVRAFNGPNRYDTARMIAVQTFGQSDNVLLATGLNYPDALAASYLAGDKQAPILLTDPNHLPLETIAAMQTLDARNVTILGGVGTIAASIETSLRNAGLNVERVAGANRYATALEVAKRPQPHHIGTLNGERTAILASGTTFADALAGGPVAYAGHFPLLLNPPDVLGPEARQGIAELGIQRILLLGGTGAMSQTIENQIKDLSVNVTRLGGEDRTETATTIATFAINTPELSFTTGHVNLALGANSGGGIDALAGGPHAGAERAPILLAAAPNQLDVASNSNNEFLFGRSGTLAFGHIFGGTNAINEDVRLQASYAAGLTPPEAPAGTSTATVFIVNVAEEYFISTAGRTYYYGGPDDVYKLKSAVPAITVADFGAILNQGDVVAVDYNPVGFNRSTFDVTTDTIETPVITSVAVAGNQVTVKYSISPLRSIGTIYVLQRSTSALPACLGPFGAFASVGNDANYDGTIVDAAPAGCHRYQVLAFVPVASSALAVSGPSGNITV